MELYSRIFNSSYLLNFGHAHIDPTLVMVVALSVLNTERIIIIFNLYFYLHKYLGADTHSLICFLNFFYRSHYLYNDKFYLEKVTKMRKLF